MTPKNAAARIDEELGVKEEVGFFGPAGKEMFGSLHQPLTAPVGTAVICCSLQAELVFNYRKEFMLARALAQRGIAVQRFHYFGTGNSDGEGEEATFETMVADTDLAVAQISEKTGIEPTLLIGARWGSLVAAAAGKGAKSLLLWEPITDGARYFREVFRNRVIRNLKKGKTEVESKDDLLRELEEKGSLDVLGYPIHKDLYESSIGKELASLVGSPPSVLLAQISMQDTLRAAYQKIVDKMRETGTDVETLVISDEESWWFQREPFQPEESLPEIRRLVETSADWALTLRDGVSGS